MAMAWSVATNTGEIPYPTQMALAESEADAWRRVGTIGLLAGSPIFCPVVCGSQGQTAKVPFL
jgi:hypothetical protein